ncbi:MAG: AsnC family transcriptional regulator [Actinobacteria bacterium]|nr:AsnC family transcriptional regulator [Actinomycetota bacterium]
MRRRAVESVSREQKYRADDLDRAILRLLQVDARRPFAAMAADLGVSDQTVARRYQRLRARAGVRVVALAQPNVNTADLWLLRVRAGPHLDTIAANLARRSDTAWIHSVCGPGGLEVVGMVYRDRGEAGSFALLEQLSASPSVTSATAQACLHMFFGGPDSLLTKSTAPPDERSAGPDDRQPHRHGSDTTEADRRLLTALGLDGRASVKQLSQVSGLAPETVTHRIGQLKASGTLYFDVDFDPGLLGLRCGVSLWLTVTPARLEDAGRLMAAHQEISFATATTGTTNIYAVAHCVDTGAMYRYLSGPVAELPGLNAVEAAPHIRDMKKAQGDPATP